MPFPSTSSHFTPGGLPVCNTDAPLAASCFIFQLASESICFQVSLFLPSSNTFLCYINNLHLPSQIWGAPDFHRCRFLFQTVCLWWTQSSDNVSLPSLFQMTWNADFLPPFNSVSFCDPSMFSSPFFQVCLCTSSPDGIRDELFRRLILFSLGLFGLQEKKKGKLHTLNISQVGLPIFISFVPFWGFFIFYIFGSCYV